MTSRDSFYKFLETRRSIRRYRSAPIPEVTVRRLLEAARAAPSAHNRQPWRFALISDQPRKSELAQAMGAKLRADRLRDGDPPDAIAKDVARSYERISGAPLVIVACQSMADMDRYRDEERSDAERLMATQSVAIACHNILLAAHAEGLGASWMCAPLFCPEVVVTTLGLPQDWRPQALLTIGVPLDSGKVRPRHRIEEISRIIG